METDRTCDACGRIFTPKRADARHCSGACRAKASRDRRRDDALAPTTTDVARAAPRSADGARPVEAPEGSALGLREDLTDRFFDLESQVAELGDDLQALSGMDQRIGELRSKVEQALTEARRRVGPDEATIRSWGREASHAETAPLARRVQALESRPPEPRSDPRLRGEIAALDQRIAEVEARPMGRAGTSSPDLVLAAKVKEIERACIKMGRRLGVLEGDMATLAAAYADYVVGEVSGDQDDEVDEEEED